MQTANISKEDLLEITQKQAAVIAKLEEKLAGYEHIFQQLTKALYGSRSEKRPLPIDAAQLALFDLPQATEPEPVFETVERKKPVRRPQEPTKRMVFPEHLPREVVRIEPEGIDLSKAVLIAEDSTETLEMDPGRLYVQVIVRPRYKVVDAESQRVDFVQASIPSRYQPLSKAAIGTVLLAYLLVSKYEDHLPLHRLIKMLRREKMNRAESTVNDWVQGAMKLLEPLFRYLESEIKKSDYLMVDESPIGVQDRSKKGLHLGYYWIFLDPINNLIQFIYNKSRGGEVPRKFLESFQGYLHVDGYGAYDQFEKKDDILMLACMAHIRRKFVEAITNNAELAKTALDQIGRLYAIEKQAREANLSFDERKALRDGESAPVMESMQAWMVEVYATVLPSSAIGKALQYALRHWDRARNYLLDGRLEIDNNRVENKIRPLALGRNNYMKAGSHDSAGLEWCTRYLPCAAWPRSIPWHGSPTCWAASTTTLSTASRNCCPTTGKPASPTPNLLAPEFFSGKFQYRVERRFTVSRVLLLLPYACTFGCPAGCIYAKSPPAVCGKTFEMALSNKNLLFYNAVAAYTCLRRYAQ